MASYPRLAMCSSDTARTKRKELQPASARTSLALLRLALGCAARLGVRAELRADAFLLEVRGRLRVLVADVDQVRLDERPELANQLRTMSSRW